MCGGKSTGTLSGPVADRSSWRTTAKSCPFHQNNPPFGRLRNGRARSQPASGVPLDIPARSIHHDTWANAAAASGRRERDLNVRAALAQRDEHNGTRRPPQEMVRENPRIFLQGAEAFQRNRLHGAAEPGSLLPRHPAVRARVRRLAVEGAGNDDHRPMRKGASLGRQAVEKADEWAVPRRTEQALVQQGSREVDAFRARDRLQRSAVK